MRAICSAINVVEEMLRQNVDYCVIVDPASVMHIVGVVTMRDILVYAHRSLKACPASVLGEQRSFPHCPLKNDSVLVGHPTVNTSVTVGVV